MMAPFGKDPLKARDKPHRSSCKDMEPVERQIVVWVCQEEKIVCGITKHTTCSEVVQALLEEHEATVGDRSFLLCQCKEYCIVEKWRGFERMLPPVTKMLRLWKAWGKEQINLSFVLVKANTFLPNPMWRTAEAEVLHSLDRNHEYSPAHYIKTLPLDKQKRIVRKAFRKLDKIKMDVNLQDRDNIETLIHLIISQDHTVKQQVNRIRELDKEIGAYEASLHLSRVENNGENYVQNAYLSPDASIENSKKHTQKYFLEHNNIHDGILHIEKQLSHHNILIGELSIEIEKEISFTLMGQNRDDMFVDEEYMKKLEEYNLESVNKELDESMKAGLKVHSQFNCIQKQIKYNEFVRLRQESEYKSVEEDLMSLCAGDKNNCLHCKSHEEQTKDCTVVTSINATDDFSTRLSNLDINDTDSDTGISSTYSQDSEPISEVMMFCT
ncbi:hypothetical protein FKM82_021111 [Ascaphus truei]